MRSPKQIAIDICNGDEETKNELEKMVGKKLEEMNKEEKEIGLAFLSAFDDILNA